MPSSLASLLHHSLDFAGLFPPATLPVPEALRIFRQERTVNTAEMLSRFVCPVLRLEELVAAASANAQFSIAALPRGGRNTGEFLANLETDLATIYRLAQLNDGAISIDTIELRPPVDALEPLALRKLLAAIKALLVRKAGNVRQVFVELAPSPALPSLLELLAEQATRSGGNESPVFGYKLRTGGSDAASTPTAGQTASALAATAALGLPMKCTGGLRSPLRTISTAGSTPSHGFVNLLVAAAIVSAAPVEPAVLEAVLEENTASAFTFEGRSLTWHGHTLNSSDIAAARKRLLVSFGSCYIEQPRLELQKLGWWPQPAPAKSVQLAN